MRDSVLLVSYTIRFYLIKSAFTQFLISLDVTLLEFHAFVQFPQQCVSFILGSDSKIINLISRNLSLINVIVEI